MLAIKNDLKEKAVSTPEINKKKMKMRLIGETPLIVHQWTQCFVTYLKDPIPKQYKNDMNTLIKNFIDSFYWLEGKPSEYSEEAFAAALQDGARFGFPSAAFKSAAVSAGYRNGLIKDKVSMYGTFHIKSELIEIKGIPVKHEHTIKSIKEIRTVYYGKFPQWEAEIEIIFNADAVSAEKIIELFTIGGYACGIGEQRPEKGGDYGKYRVITV